MIDTVEQVAAEVAAALRISQDGAVNRVGDAIAMRKRLPAVGKVFLAGDIDYFMFAAIVSRTDLLTDDRMAAVDAELAAVVARWPSLSRGQRIARVDRVVARHDRDAVRRRKKKRDDRWIEIWDSGDGVSEIRGFLAGDGRPHPRCAAGRPGGHRLPERCPVCCAASRGCDGRVGRRRRSAGLRMR